MLKKNNFVQRIKSPVDFSPDVFSCFLIFTVSNGVLAYSNAPTQIKLWIALLGILVPFLYFLKNTKAEAVDWLAIKSDRLKLHPVKGFWILLLLGGGGLRFFKLLNFHFWPSTDEALQGYFAIDLIKKWSWHFFYTSGQHPPLLIWMENVLFRFSDSPFFNLKILPAFFSLVTLIMGFVTSRAFFTRSISIIFSLLLAFSYWPMLFGRFGVQGALVPFFELLCFYLLGIFLKEKKIKEKQLLGVLLGLTLGVGSLTFTGWFSVLLVIVGIVSYHLIIQIEKDFKTFSLFMAVLLVSLLPWISAVVREGFGGYLIGVSIFSGFFTGSQQIFTLLSNLTCLIWGPIQTVVDYGPTWGGVLNPILGSLFLLGLIDLYKSRRLKFTKGLILVFFVFLLPGFLSADHVEMFRIIPVLPILLFITTLGIQKILMIFPKQVQVNLLLCLLVPSFGMDFYHLIRPELAQKVFSAEFKTHIEDESFIAYQTLKTISANQGPGLIFTEFLLLPHGHNLKVTTYPFNAADNPVLNPSEARWAALITNVNYVSFLKKRFPESMWKEITPGQPQDGGLAVGIIPIVSGNRETFSEWLPIHQYFHELGAQSENMMNNPGTSEKFIERLPEGFNLINNDPYLESLFAEWCSQYHYKNGLEENIKLIKRGIAKGYPSANLYFKLGNFYYFKHDFAQAREAYCMAAASPKNITASQAVIDYLDNLDKVTSGKFKSFQQRGH